MGEWLFVKVVIIVNGLDSELPSYQRDSFKDI